MDDHTHATEVALPAVRSAAKILYSPAVTLDSPIGLRNDPHMATIIARAQARDVELDAALTHMSAYERRALDAWLDSDDGHAFTRWKKRALVMAEALDIIETAWRDKSAAHEGEACEEPLVDPGVQRMVDRAWWLDNHRVWCLIGAALVAFITFFGIGPDVGRVATHLRIGGWTVTIILIATYLVARILPGVITRHVERRGYHVSTPDVRVEDGDDTPPLWSENDQHVSSARILNAVNWALLAQPDAAVLARLDPPAPRFDEAEELSAWQRRILDTITRTYDRLVVQKTHHAR